MQRRSFLWLWKSFLALTLAAMAFAGAQAQDLKSFEQRITTKVLPNGLTLIVCERPEAPVFSYSTFIDAGDVNDPSGESGLAHMFEHLAFKGTSQIGTKDYAAEKIALAKVEAANDAYEAEYLKAVGRDEKKLAELKQGFQRRSGRGAQVRHPQPVHRRGRAQRGRGPERRNRSWTRRSTSGRCRRTGWSCGRGWRAAGWPIPCRASSTRSATW